VLRIKSGTEIFPDSPEWKAKLEKASDHMPVVVELELAAAK
jgi:hypothetical protein